MNVTYRTDKNILYIALEGRIDASNAAMAEENIFNIRKENADKHTVIDADNLEYISSAGLRIILRLRKEEPKLAIINVAPEVYEVFDMTGFTDMIKVEKAYKRMTTEGCEIIARGGNGIVYRYNDETILKTYYSKDSLPEVQRERENARKAFVLGINTAIPYGIVRVGDGYGTVTELLNAVSVTKLICDDPMNIETPAGYYVDLLKSIHSVEVDAGDFTDMRETALDWADFVSEYIPKEQGIKLRALIEAVPKQSTLLHGDYHTSNVMIQNGEPLLIDMDTLCVGHPIFELGSMYNAFLGFSSLNHGAIEKFMGYDRNTSRKFWDTVLKKYLGTDDESVLRCVEEKAMIIGYTRLLRRALRRQNEEDGAKMATHCKEMLAKLLNNVDNLMF